MLPFKNFKLGQALESLVGEREILKRVQSKADSVADKKIEFTVTHISTIFSNILKILEKQ